MSMMELESLPRSVLQRVHRAVEEHREAIRSNPSTEAELTAQWALVDNYLEVRPLRTLTWNRIRDILGLPRLDESTLS